ncbi:MBL fold metallo-hydrolase [Candidatus Babeliales bacterium]|nr:MBL fold metallo-hydrolase [Candidatus Babeliales bacterium]
MKRIFPERSYGRFVCCDGLNHEWFWPVIKTLLHSVSVFIKNPAKIDTAAWIQKPTFTQRSESLQLTWLGHSTFLIQIGGKNIITDPIFHSLSFVFRRLVPQIVKVVDLPPIDYVLISHNHFDHMDRDSLYELKKHSPNMQVLVPMGDKDWFDRHLFARVSEHMWWDTIIDSSNLDLKFTFLPANHWSQRTLFDKNRSLWGSWMIQDKKSSVYFAGDTSFGVHFEQIGNEFKNIDVALLPIAPGEPRSWMKDTHINAYEAVQAFIKLKAKVLIPMHWGTYHLGFDEFYEPIQLLKKSWHELRNQLTNQQLKISKFGELIEYVKIHMIPFIHKQVEHTV